MPFGLIDSKFKLDRNLTDCTYYFLKTSLNDFVFLCCFD